jgi:NAD(P)-dependent dehydrogenase (short-subunit alcohol dehydrogenase family)
MKFKDKIVIVTGGTGALGQTVTKAFASDGAKVYVPCRSVEKCRDIFDYSAEAEEEGKTFTLKKIYSLECDAGNELSVTTFINDIIKMDGRIDILVNTIGGYHPRKTIAEMDYKLLHEMMALNFRTTFLFTKFTLDEMVKRSYGRLISIASGAVLNPTAGKFAYAYSKSGVINLMETIAEENKDADITANTIAPYMIDTSANRSSMPGADFSKWAKTEEIAKIILFLASDESGKITGNTIKLK